MCKNVDGQHPILPNLQGARVQTTVWTVRNIDRTCLYAMPTLHYVAACATTRTLKLCKWGEPAFSFCHVSTPKDRKGVERPYLCMGVPDETLQRCSSLVVLSPYKVAASNLYD